MRSLAEEYKCFNPRGPEVPLLPQQLGPRPSLHPQPPRRRSLHPLLPSPRRRQPQGRGPGRKDTRTSRPIRPTSCPTSNGGKDPEAANPRYHIRGNGLRDWTPALTAAGLAESAYSASGIKAIEPAGRRAGRRPASRAKSSSRSRGPTSSPRWTSRPPWAASRADDLAAIAVSTNNGRAWKEVWRAEQDRRSSPAELQLIEPVNGAYEVLVKVEPAGQVRGRRRPACSRSPSTPLRSSTARPCPRCGWARTPCAWAAASRLNRSSFGPT